ncbi:MAG: helix-turn-helix transcriptional regulator [Nitrospirae bacterium]|nr:helix-turn-helix transcriptional regulator [Nitrospirota bacterium]
MAEVNIGGLIRHLRKTSGMTQMGLADKLSLTYQQVQKYERGRSELTIRRLRQVADALHVPISIFIRENNKSIIEEMADDEIEILTTFRRLKDKRQRHMAVRMLKVMIDTD